MNYTQLTENERYQIYTLIGVGFKQKDIAELIDRSPSTISRELKRNTGKRGYRPRQAQNLTDERRATAFKYRKVTKQVAGWLEKLIRQELSPQQAVDYLIKHKKIQLHWETVYQWIYQDKADGGDLYTHLRVASKPYRKRYGHYDSRGRIVNRVSIDDRPEVVERRNRIGDWEGDTIIGHNRRSALLTMVERKSLYTVIARLNGKNAEELAVTCEQVMAKFRDKVKTITLDNGLEFSSHEKIARALSADIYFAHPYASWERGTNENTNGLIRQYFPKGTDFSKVTDREIEHVMDRLNNRPRATRKNRSPNEIFMGLQVDLLAT